MERLKGVADIRRPRRMIRFTFQYGEIKSETADCAANTGGNLHSSMERLKGVVRAGIVLVLRIYIPVWRD